MERPEGKRVRVFFDATRLLTRVGMRPTGIDRVDLAYARALSNAPHIDLRMILFGPFGPRLLSFATTSVLIGIPSPQRRAKKKNYATQCAFDQICTWLHAPPGTQRPRLQPAYRRFAVRPATRLKFIALLRYPIERQKFSSLLASDPQLPAVYLNTSHGRLYRHSVAKWLAAKQIPAVFFVHDLIPIEYPEFSGMHEPARHAARLDTISTYASRVLVNSRSTRDALSRYLSDRRMRLPQITVIPLGVNVPIDAMLAPPRTPHPYFVVLSTIEPRKNHRLLLRVWQRWIASEGNATPRLLILGRRGWLNEAVFHLLDHDEALRKHVVECAELNDEQVISLLKGARALLSPSLAEGFGLPVAEALSAGTCVIASEISAHREVAGAFAEYLDPEDEDGWLRSLKAHASAPAGEATLNPAVISSYQPPSWQNHFSQVFAAIDQLVQ